MCMDHTMYIRYSYVCILNDITRIIYIEIDPAVYKFREISYQYYRTMYITILDFLISKPKHICMTNTMYVL